MTLDRWQQISRLYNEALAHSASERRAFLAGACGGDEALRREVESLLAQPALPEAFLEAPAVAVAAKLVSDPGTSRLTGRRLGVYQLQELLGAGGMGEVYRAHDTKLGRDVAVKVLPALFANNPAWLARFRQEAKVLASLNHPNICIIFGLGESAGQHFIAMECVEGRPLAEVIASGGLVFASIVRYGIQIADALAHAHARDIVHRDLKSSNVMIAADGRPKVLDFGLAIGLGQSVSEMTTVSEPPLAGPSAIVGTLPYMAPEILRGGVADARSDLWALGIILYEMATGKLPFTGKTAFDLTSAIMRDPTPYPSGLKLDRLHAVTERCLAKDPLQRYQSAVEVRAALESLQSIVPPSPARGGQRRSESARHGPASVGPSIAVLPFTNLSPEPDQEYFCDGITEEIINGLTKIQGLHVVGRTSAFRFKGRMSDIAGMRKRLKVNTVLEGSVRKAGNQLRISANLINTSDGYHLWSERFDREVRDVFAIQDEISRAIVEKLKIKLSQEPDNRLIEAGTSNPTAYNLYLRGRFQLNKRTPEAVQKAIEHFEQAAIADSLYAPAYAGLADANCLLTIHATTPPRALMPKAKAAALQAVTLDDALGPAHTSLGFIHATYDWDWRGAEREFLRAIALNPGDSNAHHWYGIDCLAPLGRLDEALVEMTRAAELDPLSVSINTSLGGLFHDRREYPRAIEQYQTTIELEPNFYFSYWNLGRTYEQLKEYEKAMEMFQKAQSLAPRNHSVITYIARCHALMGNVDEARKLFDELVQLRRTIFVPSTALALIHFSLGENDRGFELMHAACEERTVWLIWSKVSPTYDSLRADPRFATLLKKLGL